MPFFYVINLVVDLVLHVLDGATDVLARLLCLVGCFVLVGMLHGFGRVFSVAPSFLGCSLGLVNDSLVSEFLIAYSFADALFRFADSLIHFARNLILIHEISLRLVDRRRLKKNRQLTIV